MYYVELAWRRAHRYSIVMARDEKTHYSSSQVIYNSLLINQWQCMTNFGWCDMSRCSKFLRTSLSLNYGWLLRIVIYKIYKLLSKEGKNYYLFENSICEYILMTFITSLLYSYHFHTVLGPLISNKIFPAFLYVLFNDTLNQKCLISICASFFYYTINNLKDLVLLHFYC